VLKYEVKNIIYCFQKKKREEEKKNKKTINNQKRDDTKKKKKIIKTYIIVKSIHSYSSLRSESNKTFL